MSEVLYFCSFLWLEPKDFFMNDIVIDVPLEKIKEDEKLFEYISFKKARKTPEVYQAKVHNAFINYFTQSSSHSSTSHTHHRNKIIIKNIGNMKRTHLHNALSYTIEKSYQESMNIFDDMDFHTELLSQHKKCAIDYLGNFVGVDEILKDWQKDFSSNKNTNEALHLVFSLNEIHSPTIMEILLQSAQNTLQSHFAEYKYILVPHAHQNKPHIHIIINKTNIFSKKKLHFNSKQECAAFYDSLREDFKQNLFVLSNGKLDYSNDVKVNRDFLRQHLDSKLENLDKFNTSNANKDDSIEQDVRFFATYKKAINSLNAKIKSLYSANEILKQEMWQTSRHLKNVEKKIKELESKGINPTQLKEKRLLLFDELSHAKNQMNKNERKANVLREHMKRFLDWEDTYKSFSHHFTLLNKKKSILSSFKSYERYLPLDVIDTLKHFKRDIAQFENTLGTNIEKMSSGIIAEVTNYNHKSNALSKKLSHLLHYKHIVSTLTFPQNNALESKKKECIDTLECNAQSLLQAIKQRMIDINAHLALTKEDLEQSLAIEHKDIKRIAYLHKKCNFLLKEQQVCERTLHKHNIALNPIPNAPQSQFSESIVTTLNLAHKAMQDNRDSYTTKAQSHKLVILESAIETKAKLTIESKKKR